MNIVIIALLTLPRPAPGSKLEFWVNHKSLTRVNMELKQVFLWPAASCRGSCVRYKDKVAIALYKSLQFGSSNRPPTMRCSFMKRKFNFWVQGGQ